MALFLGCLFEVARDIFPIHTQSYLLYEKSGKNEDERRPEGRRMRILRCIHEAAS